MFCQNDIVKVLIPNVINTGYDYCLTVPADIGNFVRVTVMNRPYFGVIVGAGDSGYTHDKIKKVSHVFSEFKMSKQDIEWIYKIASWTMMSPGAVLRLIINTTDAFDAPKSEELFEFNMDKKIRMTDARQAVMDACSSNDNEPMSKSDIQNIARVSSSVVNSLIKNETLIPVASRVIEHEFSYKYFDTGNIKLNDDQQLAADTIANKINFGFDVFVLDGITGSGKTQVYFDSALRAYNAGKSVLLMMPEIALTAQFMDRFKKRFGASPVVWHSNLTAAKRRDIWRGVLTGKIKMVVGTRSALFLPWQDLGLIVVDEEHDGSYKQEDMGIYHARDMAVLRAQISNFPIVLASATPSAETVKNINSGKYKILKLTSRFGGASLPVIKTIDLKESKPEKYKIEDTEKPGNLSPVLCDEIQRTLAERNQIMLFINRRGFSPNVCCKSCGWNAGCDECSVGMTYHKRNKKLICHMCGRSENVPHKCPKCGGDISFTGTGLEKVQEEIHARFPNAKTALVSSDTMMSRQALQRLVDDMEAGKIDIVIGTQILAKGHHFPNLTLVGVVDSDMGLYGADFRAGEHTFAQLFQVAGRAGRGDKPGRVLLQTYQPDNPVLKAICDLNRDEFMTDDLHGRELAKMPPFGNLIAVIVEGKNEKVLQKYCADLSAVAPKLIGGDAKIMGPIPAGIYQIRQWYRMRFLVSGSINANLQDVVKNWFSKIKQPINTRVKFDVNPQNFS